MKKQLIYGGVIITLLAACNGSTPPANAPAGTEAAKDTSKKMTEGHKMNELAEFEFTTLVGNIHSPLEIIGILPKTNVVFDKKFVNPTENENKYTTTTRKALNYGVYLVDLVYLSTNDQTSSLKSFFMTSRNLAKSLECAETFDRIAGSRAEKNIDKKDSINKIMDQLFADMDKYLKSNERLLVSTQILVGSWVESQYITVNALKGVTRAKENEALFQKLGQQNFTIDKLNEIFKEFKNEKEFVPVMNGVQELGKIYSQIHNGQIDAALMDKLAQKLAEVRSKLTN